MVVAFAPVTVEHGPECHLRFGTERGRRGDDCQCIACHCFIFSPGGFLGTCQRCGRPRIENGKVVR